MPHLAQTILDRMIAANDPQFAEDIAHLQRLIDEAATNDARALHISHTNILTKSSTSSSIAELSKGLVA